jgi:hypothetical protein
VSKPQTSSAGPQSLVRRRQSLAERYAQPWPWPWPLRLRLRLPRRLPPPPRAGGRLPRTPAACSRGASWLPSRRQGPQRLRPGSSAAGTPRRISAGSAPGRAGHGTAGPGGWSDSSEEELLNVLQHVPRVVGDVGAQGGGADAPCEEVRLVRGHGGESVTRCPTAQAPPRPPPPARLRRGSSTLGPRGCWQWPAQAAPAAPCGGHRRWPGPWRCWHGGRRDVRPQGPGRFPGRWQTRPTRPRSWHDGGHGALKSGTSRCPQLRPAWTRTPGRDTAAMVSWYPGCNTRSACGTP